MRAAEAPMRRQAPTGGVMDAPWGAMLEAELAGVDVVRAYVLMDRPADPAQARLRRPERLHTVLPNSAEAVAMVCREWSPGRTFMLRELPALRLHTTAGRLLVADVWGDSGFRPLSVRSGADVLRLDTPMINLLRAVDDMRAASGPGSHIEVVPIGWRSAASLDRTDPLRAWRTVETSDVKEGSPWTWRSLDNDGIGDGPWAALRAFGQVNQREGILRSARLIDTASDPRDRDSATP